MLSPAKSVPVRPAIAAPNANATSFSRFDGDAHQLGGERILAERLPRAARARLVDEIHDEEREHEDDERGVEVPLQRADLEAAEVEVVDVRDAVRPAGDVEVARQAEERDRVAVLIDGDEELQEEERDDREVVADEASRRKRDEQAEDRSRDDDDRDDEQRVPVQAEMRRGEHRVAERAEAVERDVAEIEQPRVADGDVQPEREQHVEQRVEADADDVPVAREDREKRRSDAERRDRTPAAGRAGAPPRRGRRCPPRCSRRTSCVATQSSTPTRGSMPGPSSIRPFAPAPGRAGRSGGRASPR